MQQLTADEIPDLLARLVDKSLVQVDSSGRYNLLNLVRAFAEEVTPDEESAQPKNRHLDFYTDFSAKWAEEMHGPNQANANEQFVLEAENLRRAVEWAAQDADEWPRAVKVLDDIFWTVVTRGVLTEGVAMAASILDHAPSGADFLAVSARTWLNAYLTLQKDSRSKDLGEETFAAAEKVGNAFAIYTSLAFLGFVALNNGRFRDCDTLMNRALVLARLDDTQTSQALQHIMLGMLGNNAVMLGDLDRAKELFGELLAKQEVQGNPRGIAMTYGCISLIHERSGEYEEAHKFALLALPTMLRVNDLRNVAAYIASAASGFWVGGDYGTAAMMVGCAFGMWEDIEGAGDAVDQETAERWRARLMEKMGDEAFRVAFEHGKEMPLEDAVQIVLDQPEPWNL